MEAYNEALTLYSAAQNLQLPGVSVERLMDESNRIKDMVSARYYTTVNKVLNSNHQVLFNVSC